MHSKNTLLTPSATYDLQTGVAALARVFENFKETSPYFEGARAAALPLLDGLMRDPSAARASAVSQHMASLLESALAYEAKAEKNRVG